MGQRMCEVVVCVSDMGPGPREYKQGDVIEVQADGFDWGPAVMGQVIQGNPNGNHPFWRLLKLPNVTVAQAINMLTPEVDSDPLNPSPYLQRRAFFLDKAKIPNGALKTYWNDDTRTAAFITLPHTAAQFAAIRTQRTPVPF